MQDEALAKARAALESAMALEAGNDATQADNLIAFSDLLINSITVIQDETQRQRVKRHLEEKL